MIVNFCIRTTQVLALILFFCTNIYAQNEATPRLLLSDNLEDSRKLLNAYFGPAYKAMGASLNTAWFNTAEVYKLGRFDIRLVTSATFSPSSDRSFDATTLGLSPNINVTAGTSSPTVFGANEKGQSFDNRRDAGEGYATINQYQFAEGSGTRLAPLTFLQVNVGIFKGTEVAVRFLPKVGSQDTKGGLLGIGIKHDIKQWIRDWALSNFDLSVGFGYTNFNLDYGVSLPAETYFGDKLSGDLSVNNPNAYDGQKYNFKVNAYNFTILFSKKISHFTFFGGPRYDLSKSTTSAKGLFPVTVYDSEIGFKINNINDPIKIENSYNQIALNGGVRWQTGAYNMALQGTLAKYPSVNLSLGFGLFNK